ncbi:hypothetical protein ACP275_14G108500 [Erythranthe tilingii]
MANKILILFSVLCLVIDTGSQVYAVPYDYSYTKECLAKPLKPQYEGGVIVNPELNEGLKGWTRFEDSTVEHRESDDGNKYIVASARKQPFHSFSQKFNLEKEKLYTFSAWLQVSHEKADIAAIFKTNTSNVYAGWVTAQNGCWSMVKGGLVVNVSGPAELYFESNNTNVDIWADSISLQPFTQQEWKSHQDQSIEKFRKSKVKFQAVDQHGQPVPNATVSIKQNNANFPFGCAMNQNIVQNGAYQNYFFSRFKYTVFQNELKWASTEYNRGSVDYSVPDAMIALAKSHGVTIRGHNVLWDDPKYQPYWVPGLSANDLGAAAQKRLISVMTKYKGRFIHWDVVNENLHWNFFESRLGPNISTVYYKYANKIDGSRTIPFLNEYNTIEESRDGVASPSRYLQKIDEMRRGRYGGPLGIGAQGHFTSANLPYTRSAIDMLASAKLPLWVTELDVTRGPNQANILNQVLREIHSHSAVQGIMLWTPWDPQGCDDRCTNCYATCLTDNNFRNTDNGNVVDSFRNELTHADGLRGTTDSNGFFEASLFHGEYEAKIINGDAVSSSQEISVVPNEETVLNVHRLTVNV